MEKLETIDSSTVESLEEYLLKVGVLSVSLASLKNLHASAVKAGIFSDDEIENSKTIEHGIDRLFTSINDQIRMTSSRTKIKWPALLKKIVKKAKKEKVKCVGDSGSSCFLRPLSGPTCLLL